MNRWAFKTCLVYSISSQEDRTSTRSENVLTLGSNNLTDHSTLFVIHELVPQWLAGGEQAGDAFDQRSEQVPRGSIRQRVSD
jgi:hypothetical protein